MTDKKTTAPPIIKYGKSNADYVRGKNYLLERSTNQYWLEKAIVASAEYAKTTSSRTLRGMPGSSGKGSTSLSRGRLYAVRRMWSFQWLARGHARIFEVSLRAGSRRRSCCVRRSSLSRPLCSASNRFICPKADFLIEALRSVEAESEGASIRRLWRRRRPLRHGITEVRHRSSHRLRSVRGARAEQLKSSLGWRDFETDTRRGSGQTG